MGREKASDEVFCTSCGEPIKQQAEVCPHCGVKNQNQTQIHSSNTSREQDSDDIIPKLIAAVPWVFGVLFILAGFGTFTGGGNILQALLGGLIITATGAFALPPVRERLEPIAESKGIELTRVVVVVIVIAGVFVGVGIAPDTGGTEEPAAASGVGSATSTAESNAEAATATATPMVTTTESTSEPVSNTEPATGTPTATQTAEPTPEPTTTQSGSGLFEEPTYKIRVKYRGDWSGAMSVTSSGSSTSESYSGSGTETITLEGSPTIISANAQKKDGGTGTLVIQILEDGAVISEASTSAEYGVAQTSKRV